MLTLLETVNLSEAAALLCISEDSLMRKARVGIVPGAKIGRQWVFVRADLIGLIHNQAKERACRYTSSLKVPIGTCDLQSVDANIDAALAQLQETRQRNTRLSSVVRFGDRSDLASDPDTRGRRPSRDGTPRLKVVGKRTT